MAAFGVPPPRNHILSASLAACSPGANRLEKEAPQPTAFGEAHACETVGFSGRLRKKPAGIPYGRQLSQGRQGHWSPLPGPRMPQTRDFVSSSMHCLRYSKHDWGKENYRHQRLGDTLDYCDS